MIGMDKSSCHERQISLNPDLKIFFLLTNYFEIEDFLRTLTMYKEQSNQLLYPNSLSTAAECSCLATLTQNNECDYHTIITGNMLRRKHNDFQRLIFRVMQTSGTMCISGWVLGINHTHTHFTFYILHLQFIFYIYILIETIFSVY